jgi:hypothetical protein
MKIEVIRSGGFAGLRRSKTIDANQLSASDRKRIEEVLNAANFFKLPETVTQSQSRDEFQYRISINVGGESHTIVRSERELTGPLNELLSIVDLK